MGYYSSLEMDTKVKDDCLNDVRGLFAEIKVKMASGAARNWEKELDWLIIDEKGEFESEDWYAKWYRDEKWIQKLTPFLEDGTIEFLGEDSERWGYIIEDGKTYIIEYKKTKGSLLTE